VIYNEQLDLDHVDLKIISWNEFENVDLRIGKIVSVEDFPKARNPAYKVFVDFGPEFGVLQTSAQITKLYTKEELSGRYVIGCINLGTKNIAGFTSQFLLTGFEDANGNIALATIHNNEKYAPKLGAKLK